MRRQPISVLVAAAALAVGATAQQPPPQFRSDVETVALYATVLDRYGLMALNLTREDFEVLDNGQPQALTVFDRGLLPITAVLLIDTSASMTLNLELAQTAAEQFVIRMLPGDRARVGTFDERIDLTETFTEDRDALLTALRVRRFGNPTRLWDAVGETMSVLAPVSGRRIIVLLTDGLDTASRVREADVLARAQAEEVMIYVVQFRSNPRAQLAEYPMAPSASSLLSGESNRRTVSPTPTLRRLSTLTGGGHFALGEYDNVNATFTSVMQELHYQYVLGFTPRRQDGQLHALTVRVRRPGHVVRARQHYLAPVPRQTVAQTP
jgi:Ca-activated chloride channel family protein